MDRAEHDACCALPHTFNRHGASNICAEADVRFYGPMQYAARVIGVFMVRPLVLVVEDEFLVRMNAVSLLEEAGFGVLEAASADDAIALLESRKDIRIVFTDINMPGSMDGLRLAHAIRNRWPPIELVLTSGQMRVRSEDMPERGHFLSKPYDPSELVEVVRSLAV
jgi:CheY-like chemotaxis protein